MYRADIYRIASSVRNATIVGHVSSTVIPEIGTCNPELQREEPIAQRLLSSRESAYDERTGIMAPDQMRRMRRGKRRGRLLGSVAALSTVAADAAGPSRAAVRGPLAAGRCRISVHLADVSAVSDQPLRADRPAEPVSQRDPGHRRQHRHAARRAAALGHPAGVVVSRMRASSAGPTPTWFPPGSSPAKPA